MDHIGCSHITNGEGGNSLRTITFRFKREELLYDIKNYAYIEGHVLGEEEQHAQHTLVEIGEEGNVDRVTRILDVIHAAAVEMLYPFTKADTIDGEELSDELRDSEEYVIELHVPDTMSRTTVRLLHKLIHEFMVYRVMHDWLCITYPTAAGHWLEKAMEAADEINSIKNVRTGVLRRKGHPF